MKLRAPDNFGGASVQGRAYEAANDGSVDVDDGHAEQLRAHGFTDWHAPADHEDEFDGMNRNGLFAWARANKLSMNTPITLDEQRALCRAHKTTLLDRLEKTGAEGKTALTKTVDPKTTDPKTVDAKKGDVDAKKDGDEGEAADVQKKEADGEHKDGDGETDKTKSGDAPNNT